MKTFEVHTYAPELNKVFNNGIEITSMFVSSVITSLTKDYKYNLQIIRKAMQPYKGLRTYKLVATKPNGETETRFCNVPTIKDAHEQYKKAKAYYNIEGTKLEFKRILKY